MRAAWLKNYLCRITVFSFYLSLSAAISFRSSKNSTVYENDDFPTRRLDSVKGMRAAVFQVHMEGNLGDEMET